MASSIWLSALRQPAHQGAAPKCHTPSPCGCPSCGGQCTVVPWQATAQGIPQPWPVAITAWRFPKRVEASSHRGPLHGNKVAAQWSAVNSGGGYAVCNQIHGTGKWAQVPFHFAPQPNFSVKPTPTSSACRFPACFALRCSLPSALGFWLP